MLRASSPRPTVLLVQPEADTADDLVLMLAMEGFHPVVVLSGDEAIRRLATIDPSIVLVEYELPDPGGGPALCRQIREQGGPPIIVLSRSDGEAGMLESFDAGADDYVHQLSRLSELAARIRATLRRSPTAIRRTTELVTVDDVELDVESHEVRVAGCPVRLPLREFRLLHVLMSSAGRTWTRTALMRRVWGETPPSGTKSLDVHIKRIRARIEDDPQAPKRILTVRGVGYRYAAASDPRPPR